MDIQTCYTLLNGNYAEAIQRLMTDKLIERFVLKFPNDPSMQQLREAVAAGDIEESFRAAHTLKGVTANLSFTALQQASSKLTEQLRSCTEPADPALYQAVEETYQKTIDAIAAYNSQA